MKYDNVRRAVFLERLNRFAARVELDGQAETVHVKNSGRCRELRLPAINAGGHYYVPFTGEPGDFDDGYSVYRLITGQIPPAAWANKVVLIGPYAASLMDDYFTSINKASKMYGVEYQANVI